MTRFRRSAQNRGSARSYLHEQTGLTAGTIADDDELATDLGHLDRAVSV